MSDAQTAIGGLGVASLRMKTTSPVFATRAGNDESHKVDLLSMRSQSLA